MTRVQDTAILFDNLDNLYDGFGSYTRLSKLGKSGKVLAEVGGKIDNAAWLYAKLKSGYKVIDIGIDLARKKRSSSYAMKRVVM